MTSAPALDVPRCSAPTGTTQHWPADRCNAWSRNSTLKSPLQTTTAALPPGVVDRVFLTDGTAFVPAVRRLFEVRFGQQRMSGGGEFVSVAEGVALIGQIE